MLPIQIELPLHRYRPANSTLGNLVVSTFSLYKSSKHVTIFPEAGTEHLLKKSTAFYVTSLLSLGQWNRKQSQLLTVSLFRTKNTLCERSCKRDLTVFVKDYEGTKST